MINSLFSLPGKKALITGGSKGIGKAIAAGLAQAGADVYLVCRDDILGREALNEITSGLSVKGGVYSADLTSRANTRILVETVQSELGSIDILIHSAGGNRAESISDLQDNSWDAILELNLSSAMVLVRGLAPGMTKKGWGRMVLVSSIMGIGSREERGTYSASKAGLIGFMKSAALELGPQGVTVNCLAPGPIETDLTANLLRGKTGKEYAGRVALGRWGKTEELVGPALLLASDAGSFVTGTTLVVDGGALSRAL